MSQERYWGLYCPQHGVWFKEDDKHILHYPDEALTRAHLNQLLVEAEHYSAMRLHLWEVTEFGQERRTKPEGLPPGSALCATPINLFKDLNAHA